MADKTLLDLSEVFDLQDTDYLYLVRGVSADRDKKIKGDLFTSAIHDDIAGEINAISEKALPINNDIIIIEDSADSYNKKKAKLNNLPLDTTNFDKRLSSADDTVQEAIETLDDYPFGLEYDYSESLSESSTTSATYVQKLRHNIPAGNPAGTYMIYFQFNHSANDENEVQSFQVELDDTTVLEDVHTVQKKKYADGVYNLISGWTIVALTAGAHTIDIDYAIAAAMTVYIKNCKLAIWRIS